MRLIWSNRNNAVSYAVSYAPNTFIPQTSMCLSGFMMKHIDHTVWPEAMAHLTGKLQG